MKIAISQPTFLPWQGYFSLINEVDEFIFLDSVQFNKRSWQQRNYIILDSKKKFITIPVKSKGKYDQLISEVEIDYSNFSIKKILKTLENAYKKAPFFHEFYEEIKFIFQKEHKFLCELNIEIIKAISKKLGFKTKFINSSNIELNDNYKKLELITKLATKRGASTYISTIGSKEYINKFDRLPGTEIKINYFDYKNYKYKQMTNDFIEKMSILDLIFNVGFDSKKILIKNFFIV